MSEFLGSQVFALRSIYIRESNIRMIEDFDPSIPGQELFAQFRSDKDFRVLGRETRPPEGAPIRSAIFILGFEFRYRLGPAADQQQSSSEESAKQEEKGDGVASITARIALDYVINGDAKPSEDEMQRWGNSTAIVHAWPYWREYCHSSLTRMNLPLTIMPMLNIGAVEKAAARLESVKKPKDSSRKRSTRAKTK